MSRTRGFTLIEVMVTVAIVAILAAIALPSYSEYVRRGRVSEGLSQLAGMRVKMEQYFQDLRTYNGTPAPCTNTSIAPAPVSTNFDFTCGGLSGSTYQVIATGKAGTTLEGFQYTLGESNQRTSVMTPPSTWPSSASCWVTKKDGSC